MSAQLSPTPPALAEHAAPNDAPLAPLLQIADGVKPTETTFSAYIKRKFEYHYNMEKRVRDSMYAAGYRVAMFMEGKQFLTPNRWVPGQWLPYTPKSPSELNKRALNFVRFYTSNSLWKWQLSNPDIVAVAGTDTEQARQAAKAADVVTEYHERQFFAPRLTIQEALQGLCWGTYVWEIDYDPDQHSVTALQPIFGEVPVTLGGGWGQCGSCPYSGTADQFAPSGPSPDDPFAAPGYTCPQCGGEAAVDPPATELMPSITGMQEIKLGKLVARLKPFVECAWDFRYALEESSWSIHQRLTSTLAVRRLLGNIKLPSGGVGLDDYGLQLLGKLAWVTGGGSGTSRQDERKREVYNDPATVIEYSLGPDDIADCVLKVAERTVDGGEIPAGPLLQKYPNGVRLQGLNGMTVITSVRDAHHSRNLLSGAWHARANSGMGQGNDDLVEVQSRFNADDSQISTYLRASGTPGMLYRKSVFGGGQPPYLGDPSINIPIIDQNLPDGTRMEDVVRPAFQPGSVPSQFFNLVYQRYNDFAQITSHITDFSGGLPGINNKTATGAQISQANSNALFTPPLQIKGEIRKRIAEITVDLYREHFPITRYFPLGGKHSFQQGMFLSGADLKADISFEVVKDSELPRNMFTKREDYAVFFQMIGNAVGYEAMQRINPDLLVELEKSFGVQLNSEAYDHTASLCQQRLTQISSVMAIAPDPQLLTGLATDPMTGAVLPTGIPGAIDPPIVLEEPDHQLKAKWFSQWLDTNEGQRGGPVLRASVILLIQFHFALAGLQAGAVAEQTGAVTALGAAPGAAVAGPQTGTDDAGAPDVQGNVPDVNKRPGPVTGRPAAKK